MKKIPSLFKRNYDTKLRLVYNELVKGTEWVLLGEGIATRKYDGTCCMFKEGKLYKRYEVKKGKTPPEDFMPATEPDPITGKQQGWRPVTDSPEDKWHLEALETGLIDGTYELCGPKVQGNPENLKEHILIPHGVDELADCPRAYTFIKKYLHEHDIEGVVWHHPDGRMVKIKKRDFGLKRSKGVDS